MKVVNFAVMAVALFATNSMVSVYAANQQLNSATKLFSVKLGATRVIYHAGTAGATLSVSNPQNYPILVQSSVKAADKSSPAPFLVMPPLFRLEANQQSQLRIVRTGGDMPTDRETLQWVCIKAVRRILYIRLEDVLKIYSRQIWLAIFIAEKSIAD